MLVFAIVGAALVIISRAASPSIGPVTNTVIYNAPGLNAFPALERLKNGDLLVVFRSGSTHSSSDGKLIMGRSADNGFTWNYSTVYDDPARDDRVNTGLKQLSDGTILLPFVKAGGPNKEDTYILKSTNSGYNWSAPISVPNPNANKWLYAYGRILELPDKLIMPAYQRMINDSLPQEAVLMYSTDKGQTWKLYSTIAYSESIYWNETSIVATSNTNWLAYVRQGAADPNEKIYQYKTTNSGSTWTNSQLTTQISPEATVLSSGRLLLCTGGARGTGGATTIKCQLSSDSGSSWFGAKDIFSNASGGDGGYPSTVQLGNGDILTAYYLGANLSLARYRDDGAAPTPQPVPVVSLSASSTSVQTNSALTLSWSATNNPTSCTASGTWGGNKPASGSENRNGDTVSAGTKTYTLTCGNSGGSNSKTISVNVTNPPPPPLPSAPQNLHITGSDSTSITLDWDPSSGTVEYYKLLWEAKGISTTATAFKVTGLKACNSYSFIAVAHNISGDSNSSNTASGSTSGCGPGTSPPPPPPPPTCTTCGKKVTTNKKPGGTQPGSTPVVVSLNDPDGIPSGSGVEATELDTSEFDIAADASTTPTSRSGAVWLILIMLLFVGAGVFFWYRRRQGGSGGVSSDTRWPGDS